MKGMSDFHYQKYYGSEGVWKNILRPERDGKEPTTSTYTEHCRGDIIDGEDYRYVVVHVRGIGGKGFMARVMSNHGGSGFGNTDVFYGTSQEAYDKANAAGLKLMGEKQAEVDRIRSTI